jgi:hypothetical protein
MMAGKNTLHLANFPWYLQKYLDLLLQIEKHLIKPYQFNDYLLLVLEIIHVCEIYMGK